MPEPDVKKNIKKAGQKKESGAGAHGSDQKAGSGDSGEGDSRIEELQTQLQQLGEKTDELNDQLLRKSAEFENFRKRLFRDKEESIKYANAPARPGAAACKSQSCQTYFPGSGGEQRFK